MKPNARHFASRITAGFLVPAILSMPLAQAAEGVAWTDLPKQIGKGKLRSDGREDRDYHVVTKAGVTYSGHQLLFGPDEVRLNEAGPAIPREQVTEIRYRSNERVSDALVAPAGAFVSGDPSIVFGPLGLIVMPILAGVTAAAAPVVLSVQGVKWLLPDTVVKVAP